MCSLTEAAVSSSIRYGESVPFSGLGKMSYKVAQKRKVKELHKQSHSTAKNKMSGILPVLSSWSDAPSADGFLSDRCS